MTTIYFMRHSEPLYVNYAENSDSLQLKNEKTILSINGERIAKEKSENEELKNFDIVFSSNYIRAISTAKYFTNDQINIVESFNERKFGYDKKEELPEDFGKMQFENYDYKLPKGESLNEVIAREQKALKKILEYYKNKKILIVGHSTALASLFSTFCEVKYGFPYKFKDKEFFDGNWQYCQTFKVDFDDNNNVVDIKVI